MVKIVNRPIETTIHKWMAIRYQARFNFYPKSRSQSTASPLESTWLPWQLFRSTQEKQTCHLEDHPSQEAVSNPSFFAIWWLMVVSNTPVYKPWSSAIWNGNNPWLWTTLLTGMMLQAGSKLLILGMAIPTFIGKPYYNGYDVYIYI